MFYHFLSFLLFLLKTFFISFMRLPKFVVDIKDPQYVLMQLKIFDNIRKKEMHFHSNLVGVW